MVAWWISTMQGRVEVNRKCCIPFVEGNSTTGSQDTPSIYEAGPGNHFLFTWLTQSPFHPSHFHTLIKYLGSRLWALWPGDAVMPGSLEFPATHSSWAVLRLVLPVTKIFTSHEWEQCKSCGFPFQWLLTFRAWLFYATPCFRFFDWLIVVAVSCNFW